MTARSTIYSEVEDSIVRRLKAVLAKSGGGDLADNAIMHYNGEVDLSGGSMAEWEQQGAPCIVVSIESMSDDQMTQEGGRHPRSFWERLEVGIYCYDDGLRASPQEAMEGRTSEARRRGIWKLFSDIRATLTGWNLLDATSASLGWEGPSWTGARKVADSNRMQLWRLGCVYEGAVQFSIDTAALDRLTLIHGDLNVEGSTLAPNPDVEENITIP